MHLLHAGPPIVWALVAGAAISGLSSRARSRPSLACSSCSESARPEAHFWRAPLSIVKSRGGYAGGDSLQLVKGVAQDRARSWASVSLAA
jgi:hypothetical protein